MSWVALSGSGRSPIRPIRLIRPIPMPCGTRVAQTATYDIPSQTKIETKMKTRRTERAIGLR